MENKLQGVKVSRLSEKRQWIMVVYVRKSDGSGSRVKCNNPLNFIELETDVQRTGKLTRLHSQLAVRNARIHAKVCFLSSAFL